MPRPKKPVHPFMLQCGLPAGFENSVPNKRSAKLFGIKSQCRGGIADERLFRKPKPRRK